MIRFLDFQCKRLANNFSLQGLCVFYKVMQAGTLILVIVRISFKSLTRFSARNQGDW